MSASRRLVLCLPFGASHPLDSRGFLLLRPSSLLFSSPTSVAYSMSGGSSISGPSMPRNLRNGGHTEQRWKEEPKSDRQAPSMEVTAAAVAEAVTNRFGTLTVAENSAQAHVSVPPQQFGSVVRPNQTPIPGHKGICIPTSYGTASGAKSVEVENAPPVKQSAFDRRGGETAVPEASGAGLSKLFKGTLLENFTVDNSTYSHAQIRATFYPKFENEKSDREIRIRMIELVSKGLATLEVSLKHSGSLFMYAGHEGGAYAKNSYGNMCGHFSR